MNLDPDQELIEQCQSSDADVFESAFYQIYKKYGDRVYNISYRILGNAEDALDVAQDSFITVFKKIKQFRRDSRFFTWFYRIVVNLSIDRRRKQVAFRVLSDSDREGLLTELPDLKQDTIERLAKNEFLEMRIQESLLKLTSNLRAKKTLFTALR